jgi:hypothetical protein
MNLLHLPAMVTRKAAEMDAARSFRGRNSIIVCRKKDSLEICRARTGVVGEKLKHLVICRGV